MPPWKDRSKRSTCSSLVILSAVVICVGCSGNDLGPTGTVRGELLYQGKPLAQGHAIVLMNLTTGYACKGDTDAKGSFKLYSWNRGNLPVGKYSVTVRPPLPEIDPETVDPAKLMDNPGLAAKMKQQFNYPRKYSQIATSGLTFTVVEGENTLNIDLK